MKFTIVVLFFGLATMTLAEKPYYDLQDAEKLFEEFQLAYKREYKDEEEKQMRFEVFKNNLKIINELNTDRDFSLEIDPFSDYTDEEKKARPKYFPVSEGDSSPTGKPRPNKKEKAKKSNNECRKLKHTIKQLRGKLQKQQEKIAVMTNLLDDLNNRNQINQGFIRTLTLADKPHYNLKNAAKLYEKYLKDFNKHYKDKVDKQIHFEAFKKTLKMINELNTPENTATFDINGFADETSEEKKRHLGYRPPY